MTASDIPWDQILPALQHNLNNSKNSVLGRSPNEVVYRFKPRNPLSVDYWNGSRGTVKAF